MPSERLNQDTDPLRLTHGDHGPTSREAVRAYLLSLLLGQQEVEPDRLIASARKLEAFIYDQEHNSAAAANGAVPSEPEAVVHSFDEHGRLLGPGETRREPRDRIFPAAGDVSWSMPQGADMKGAERGPGPHETRHYADGSSATGPGPLPRHSPDEQVKRSVSASDHPVPEPEPEPKPEPEHPGKADHKPGVKSQRAA